MVAEEEWIFEKYREQKKCRRAMSADIRAIDRPRSYKDKKDDCIAMERYFVIIVRIVWYLT